MKGSRRIFFLIIIFLSSTAVMCSAFYSVIMTPMFALYGERAMNLAISLPSIAGLVACIVAGKICDKFNKKWVFIIALVLSGITSSNLALIENSAVMIIMACLNGGVCYGLISVSTIGVITDCIADEKERGKVMGWYNGAISLSGSVMVLIYGFFAENGEFRFQASL